MLRNEVRSTGGAWLKLQLPGRVSSEKEQCACVPVTPRHGREVPAAAFLTKPWGSSSHTPVSHQGVYPSLPSI